MTEEARLRTKALRWSHCNEDCTNSDNTCPVYAECFCYDTVLCNLRTAADLIESLSEQLDEIVTKCHHLESKLEQVTRERDAAVKDLKLWCCFSCKRQSSPYCKECSRNRVRLVQGYLSGKDHYEWLGVEVE